MMCQGCQKLGAENFERARDGRTQLKHLRKKKPHCEFPEGCTCMHRPVTDNYVPRDGVA